MIPLLLSVFLLTPHLVVPCHSGAFQAEVEVYGHGETHITLLKEEGEVKEIYVNGKKLEGNLTIFLKGYTKINVSGRASSGSKILLGIYQGKRVCAGEEVEIDVKGNGNSYLPWILLISSLSLIYLLRRWRR